MYQGYLYSLNAIVINDDYRIIVVSNHVLNQYSIIKNLQDYFNLEISFILEKIENGYYTYEFIFN